MEQIGPASLFLFIQGNMFKVKTIPFVALKIYKQTSS